jgi:hypothetical protein
MIIVALTVGIIRVTLPPLLNAQDFLLSKVGIVFLVLAPFSPLLASADFPADRQGTVDLMVVIILIGGKRLTAIQTDSSREDHNRLGYDGVVDDQREGRFLIRPPPAEEAGAGTS